MSFILNQISELPKKNEASKDDLLLVDQKQADNTYISKCATLEQIGNYLTGIVKPSGGSDDGSDDDNGPEGVLHADKYMILPLSVSDIYSKENALSLPVDGVLYGNKSAFKDCYVQYPGSSNFQEIDTDFIPYTKQSALTQQRYLNLPKGTSIYLNNTKKSIMYLKITKYDFTPDNITSIYIKYDNDKQAILSSDEVESNLKGVYYYAKFYQAKWNESSSILIQYLGIYAKNTLTNTVFYNIYNKKQISRLQCAYFTMDDGTISCYGDYENGSEKSENAYIRSQYNSTKGKSLDPGESVRIGSVRANFGLNFYKTKIYKNYIKDKEEGFYFKFSNEPLKIIFYSINQLKNNKE